MKLILNPTPLILPTANKPKHPLPMHQPVLKLPFILSPVSSYINPLPLQLTRLKNPLLNIPALEDYLPVSIDRRWSSLPLGPVPLEAETRIEYLPSVFAFVILPVAFVYFCAVHCDLDAFSMSEAVFSLA